MSDKPKPWPTHGRAVEARDNVAMNAIKINRELNHLRDLVSNGEVTRADVMISIDFIRDRNNRTLITMIEQGAPIEVGQ